MTTERTRAEGEAADDQRVIGHQGREPEEEGDGDDQRDDEDRAEPAGPFDRLRGEALCAEQGDRADGEGLEQRQVGEGEGDDEADAGGDQQRLEVEGRREVDANGAADDRQCDERGAAADDEADADAERCERGDLGEEVDEDARAGSTEAAEDRDHRRALRDIGRDAGPDADAADQQRGEADDHQEAHEEVVVAHHRAEAVARGADGPGGIAERGFDGGLGLVGVHAAEQDLVVEEGAEAGEGRGAVAEDRERLGGDDDRDAEAEAAHRRVGDAAEAAADLEGRAADLDDVADRGAELVEHQRDGRGRRNSCRSSRGSRTASGRTAYRG